MMIENTAIIFGIVVGIGFLTTLMLLMANRADRVVSNAPLIEEAKVLDKRIDAKRADLLDLEEDLRKRREALADFAERQAQVDGLTRMRDDLLTEWNSLEDRRAEVREINSQTERAMLDKQALDAELAEARSTLDVVQDRLDRAERLVTRIAELEAQSAALDEKIAGMRDEAQRLEEAQARIAALEVRGQGLESSIARLDGQTEARKADLAEADARMSAMRTALADAQSEQSIVAGTLATARNARDEAAHDVNLLEEKRADLQGRLAHLEEQVESNIARLDGQTEARKADLAEADARMSAMRTALADAQSEQSIVAGTLATARNARDEAAHDVNLLEEKRADLQGRLAHLEEQVETARAIANGSADGTGGTIGDGPTAEDRLRELNVPPPVLVELAARPIWKPADEGEALHTVGVRMDTMGLEYPKRVLRAFHTAMKVNETTQMAVLAGISGTGKSQLPRQYAAGMGIGFLQVPVQPRWDSPQDLMGFYNYIEGRFRPTDMARALWQLDTLNNKEGALDDRMMMILLDEMNLARVEYYFSDFLSRLESRPPRSRIGDKNLRKDAEIELEIPMPEGSSSPRVFPGYNLLFAGTMNEDESTQSLSDKVVDRANVMRFAAPRHIRSAAENGSPLEAAALPRSRWEKWTKEPAAVAGETRVTSALNSMADSMKAFQRPFGHRLGRAMMAYVANYPDVEGSDRLSDAVADQVEMRLLPKLRGLEVDQADGAFSDLQSFVDREIGDTALAEAIGDSVAKARDGSGQFVWNGIVR